MSMPINETLQCPVCDGFYLWESQSIAPEYCPLCGAPLGLREATIPIKFPIYAGITKGGFAIGGFEEA